jgi:hypothetical protein
MASRSRVTEAQLAERRTKLIQLRSQKRSWDDIARELGYNSGAAACQDLKRTLEQRREQLALTADEYRQEELEHLEMLARKAIEVMEREHFKWIGSGDEGSSERDDGPVLAAIESLRRLSERRSRLLGLDAPTRVEAEGSLTVTVVGVDPAELT